jgi:NADH-quinone oxidoreductase subunit M
MLWLYQRIFFVEVNPKVAGLPDMNIRETLALIPMLILVLWIGVYPNAFLGFLHTSVTHLLERVSSAGTQEAAAAKAIMEVIR